MQMHNPPHPGFILKEALEELSMTVTDLAAHLGVSRVNLSRILHGRAGITADMSIKISEAFGQSPDLWFRLQNTYNFSIAARTKRKKVLPLKRAA